MEIPGLTKLNLLLVSSRSQSAHTRTFYDDFYSFTNLTNLALLSRLREIFVLPTCHISRVENQRLIYPLTYEALQDGD